jgi:dTDP-4-amino-4,6-dideoxygalactose transaminase
MEVLPDYVVRKRALANRYAEWFSGRGYEFIREPKNSQSNYWINAFITSNQYECDKLLKYTNSNKVMTRPAWTPMHTLKMYKNCLKMDLSNTQWIEERLVNIPSGLI